MTIRQNFHHLTCRIAHVCERIGRDPSSVEIIAVSKTVEVSRIKEAVAAGVKNIGENKVQEAWQKYQIVGKSIRWHLVGKLQTNKVKRALQFFDVIQSVESIHLAEEINKRAETANRSVEILIEVNTSGENTKLGVAPEKTIQLIKQIRRYPRLQIVGLMTIAAFSPDPEQARPCFVTLRQLKNDIEGEGIDETKMVYLSMGMTDDFEVAIEEGSNMVRIGRALFGDRFKVLPE